MGSPAEMNPQMIIHVVIDEIIETIEDNNSTIEQDETNTRDRDARDQQQQGELTLEAKLRKYTCAAGGGALVVLGVILTPIPLVPLGVPTIAAGLHVLGHEFEEAKQAEQKLLDTVGTAKTKVVEEYAPQIQRGITNARIRMEVANEQINTKLGVREEKMKPSA